MDALPYENFVNHNISELTEYFTEIKRRLRNKDTDSIDDDIVIDATKRGTIARFTNHSCQPSMYTKIFNVEGEMRLVFCAREDLQPGQELTYNYRFEADGEAGLADLRLGRPSPLRASVVPVTMALRMTTTMTASVSTAAATMIS